MMSNLSTICFGIIVLLYMVVPIKHILHMFQQNRYEPGRLSNWILLQGKQKKFDILALVSALVIGGTYFVEDITIRNIMCVWIVVASATIRTLDEAKKEKQYIKPLHMTARVKRQAVAMAVLNILWIGIMLTLLEPNMWFVLILVATYINWGLVYMMAICTTPIENLVKQFYMNKAKKILASFQGKIVGITGSYGKTSSKNIMQAVLSERFYSLMTPASFNTPMGITITIRNSLKSIHDVFICEMGADHVNDIKTLMNFVKPQVGVVTSIGPQHLQTFKTLDNIIKEKMKMIEMLPQDGIGILNKDNEHIRNYQIKNTCKVVWYGIDQDDVDYRAININYNKKGSTFDVVDREGCVTSFQTMLLGEHNIANILASIALGKEMGCTYPQLQDAVRKVRYVEHRLEVKKINGYTFIDDAFNSNPVGSSMALDVLKMMDGKRFVVTPGMIDLGPKQDELNHRFGTLMKDKVDVAILVGVNQTKPIVEGLCESGFDMENVKVCKTVKEAFNLVYSMATPEDTILLENDLPDAFNS